MRLCQSVRYALGIYAICFLLNGISSTEDAVQEHNTAASKASNEPEGKTIKKSTRRTVLFRIVFQLISQSMA